MAVKTSAEPLWLAPPHLLPRALDELCQGADHLLVVPGDLMPCLSANRHENAFDAHFGVARTAAACPARLLAAALTATAAHVRPVAGRGAPAIEAALLHAGLPAGQPATPQPRMYPDALRRWVHGHRLFFALIQAAIVALNQATRTPGPVCPRGTASAAAFLHAGAEALRLTASFSPADYAETVRPSMEPPHAPQGFSGLWSADHRALVTRLRLWGQSHRMTCTSDCREHRSLREAVADSYAAHLGVCERFVGSRPSLLGGANSAPVTLAALATHRRRFIS